MCFIHLVLYITFTFSSLQASTDKKTYTNQCMLTKATPINPFPNLKKCYKYNEAACCTILHDDQIKEKTEALLPSSCLRKYPEFEDLLCLACAPLESVYYDSTTKILKICKEFAMKLWNATTEEELMKPTKRFDNCGLYTQENFKTEINEDFFFPSQTGWGLSEFVTKITIPFYADLTGVSIIEGDSETCFSGSDYLRSLIGYIYIIFILCIL